MLSISFHLSVARLLRTERFYRDGLGVASTRVGSYEDGYLIIQPQDASWEIIIKPWEKSYEEFPDLYPRDKFSEEAGKGVKLNFLVANVDAVFQQACLFGGRPVSEPKNISENERIAALTDPDGYLILLTGPVPEE